MKSHSKNGNLDKTYKFKKKLQSSPLEKHEKKSYSTNPQEAHLTTSPFSACSDGPPFLHHHLSLHFLQRWLFPLFLSFSLFSLSRPFPSRLAPQTLYFSFHSQILSYKVLRTSLGAIASSLRWGTGGEAEWSEMCFISCCLGDSSSRKSMHVTNAHRQEPSTLGVTWLQHQQWD